MKLMFVGDISTGEHYFSFGHGPRSTLERTDIFQDVSELLKSADYACGNLEGPISDIGYNPKDPESRVFRGSPAAGRMLANAGFNILGIANNHIVQHGAESFLDTVTILKSNDIVPIGLANSQPLIIHKNGISVAIFSASDVPDNTDTSQSLYEVFKLDDAVERVKAIRNDVDWIIFNLHWGKEENIHPETKQREYAGHLKQAGVNIIVGHHPHIFYEIENEDRFLCAWSLGNFIFDLPWDKRLNQSGILEIALKKDSFSASVWKIDISKSGLPTLTTKSAESIVCSSYFAYKHDINFNYANTRKIIYFLLNFFKGDTVVKARFFAKKISSKIGFSSGSKHE